MNETIDKALEEVVSIKSGTTNAPRVTEVVPRTFSVYELRRNLNLSQDEFAKRYGLKVGTIRNWEQGIRSPDQSAQVLLSLIERQPDLIHELIRKVN